MKQLEGKQFGKWTVLKRAGRDMSGKLHWLCQCLCGAKHTVVMNNLTSGGSTQCKACSNAKAIIHGLSYSREYGNYMTMIQRCNNPNTIDYKYYGGKGIKVCQRWLDSILNFIEDMGPRPVGLTLDRINCKGNYEPLNCKWATRAEQVENRSRF